MPYPQAMRERAIAAHLEQDMKKVDVCRIFGIQRRTFDEWLRVYAKEGVQDKMEAVLEDIASILQDKMEAISLL